MKWSRPLFGLTLALMLAISSMGMAVTRGQAASTVELVICSGMGMMTVSLDSQGNPVGPTHPCPYCLAGHTPALLPDVATLPARERGFVIYAPTAMPRVIALSPPAALARGPPLGV